MSGFFIKGLAMSDAQPRGLRTATGFQMYPLEKIQPRARNARKHSKKQIRQIANSIEAFGFNNADTGSAAGIR